MKTVLLQTELKKKMSTLMPTPPKSFLEVTWSTRKPKTESLSETLAKESSRDYDPNGPFEDTEPGTVLFHRKRSNEAQMSSKVDWKKHPCAATSPSSMGYAPPEMCLDANYGCNSDRLRNAASFG